MGVSAFHLRVSGEKAIPQQVIGGGCAYLNVEGSPYALGSLVETGYVNIIYYYC